VEFQQFYLEGLGQASYLVGSDTTGRALVLDPRRDVDVYLDAAAERGLRIASVLDTHQHNDYLTGLGELVERTGATALGSAEGDLGYDHDPVRDGQELELGEVGVKVLHTPGHTPEHVALLLFDRDMSADEPALLLSGGALLVGDVARPDLLGGQEATRRAAQTFCHTMQTKLLELPDHVLVYPTHVSGSLCGGSIASRLSTTVGYERRTNPILRSVSSTDEFVEQCLDLSDLPAVPPYWARMRAQNQQGPALLGPVAPPAALQPEEFADAASGDAIVLDARSPEAFAGGHVPGALNAGIGGSFATWAGTVLPAGAQTLLVLDEPADLMEATWQLLRIGYDRPIGWMAGGMFAYRKTGRPLETLPTTTVEELRGRDLDVFHLLDVRQPTEWAAYHAPGAQFITGAELPERVAEVPRDRDVIVSCGSGYRSSVAASLLRREGYDNVTNLLGGMTAWKNAGLPLD
jgi:hydroxyacylglutathione hydrolase